MKATNKVAAAAGLLLLALALGYTLASPVSAQTLSCRMDSFGTTRCSDGTTYRTDSFGTITDNHGNSWRTDSSGVAWDNYGNSCQKDINGNFWCNPAPGQ